MRFPLDGTEEMAFKRVEEGWIYRLPNKWLIGPSQHVLLNEKQKAEVAFQQRRVSRWFSLALIGAISFGTLIVFPAFKEQPLLQFISLLLFSAVIGAIHNVWLRRAVRPIVSGLEPTTLRITFKDMFRKQADVFSYWALIGYGLFFFLLFAGSLLILLIKDDLDFITILGVGLFGYLTAHWFALCLTKNNRREG